MLQRLNLALKVLVGDMVVNDTDETVGEMTERLAQLEQARDDFREDLRETIAGTTRSADVLIQRAGELGKLLNRVE